MTTEYSEHLARYLAAAHAMQSGVAYEMNNAPTDPDWRYKDVRTGVNSAMVDMGGLAALLIEKGLFTKEEYAKAVADAMEREVANYEERANPPGSTTKISFA
jgi:hypothetical protein